MYVHVHAILDVHDVASAVSPWGKGVNEERASEGKSEREDKIPPSLSLSLFLSFLLFSLLFCSPAQLNSAHSFQMCFLLFSPQDNAELNHAAHPEHTHVVRASLWCLGAAALRNNMGFACAARAGKNIEFPGFVFLREMSYFTRLRDEHCKCAFVRTYVHGEKAKSTENDSVHDDDDIP